MRDDSRIAQLQRSWGEKREAVLLSDQNYQKCSIKKDNSLEKAVGFVGAVIISELHFYPSESVWFFRKSTAHNIILVVYKNICNINTEGK